jgi:2-polyprenyl-3-methyl-5-hydroxy-6-metoxy-1,4-benzoquinol methylase
MDISDIKKRYDVVWSSWLIEHFDNSLLAIENHIKIIRRGGIAIISIPTADSPDYYLKYIYTQPLITKYIDSDYKDRHHYGRRMTICEMESLCNQLNLKIIKKIQYGNSYRYPFELLKIVKEMLKKYKKINKRDIINIFSILLLIPVWIITNIFNIKWNSLYFVLEKN